MNAEADMTHASEPTRVRYQVLAWACSLSMLTYIDRVCIKSLGPAIQSDLSLTKEQFGLVLASFTLSYALFEMPSGWLGDRMGSRQVLTRIVIWWSLFTILSGCVWPFEYVTGYAIPMPWPESWGGSFDIPLIFNSLMLLIGIRFLFGAGEAGAYPNIARSLRSWFPYQQRGQAQGLLWMAARWGGSVAPLLAGGFGMLLGWRGSFLCFGILGFVWVSAFVYFFHNSPAEHPGVNAAERALILGDESPGPRPPLSWLTMLTSPTLWLLGFMYFVSNMGWYFFITWDERYYQEVLGLTGIELRIATSGPLFFGGIACVLGGLFTDSLVKRWGPRWGRTLQACLAYIIGGTGFLLAMQTDIPWLAVTLLCVASFIKDFAMSVCWATCLDVGHRYSGTVSGFMNMIGNLGGTVAATAVPHLVGNENPNWRLALLFHGCAFLCAAVCWPFINPRRVIVYRPEDSQKLRDEALAMKESIQRG